jgi:hypothetical protein
MASQATDSEVYDLLILVDSTYSMSSYLASLQTSLPQIIQISTLTDCFSRIGLLAYRDYCDKELLDWSGWLSPSAITDEPKVDLIQAAKNLYAMGGGDGPEATKTGLARAYELMRADATTIILLYTDAPPHTIANGDETDRSSNFGPEQKALKVETSYGGFGPQFVDWVTASKWLSGRLGAKKAQVFSILSTMRFEDAGYYNYLSARTHGACFYLNDSRPAGISKLTVEFLLAWMGAEKAGAAADAELPGYLSRYISNDGMKDLKSETDRKGNDFFQATRPNLVYGMSRDHDNITKSKVTAALLKKHLPKKATPVEDFSKHYKVDERYRRVAVEQLKRLIEDDVVAISVNPVFGSLWRAVCNDRENKSRDAVIQAFGLQVDRIKDAGEKTRMKTWLEESYDYTAEVTEAIESVPEAERFPCLFLDPTLNFTRERDVSAEADDDGPITSFQRDELLEIGRSCDYRILRRLGRVLTRLTYVNSPEDMPAHIIAASEMEIPRIPMALASPKYKRKFWKILLHIVVPGTMLGARPAALLAALSIKLGVQPLMEAAEQEMLLWPARWNNLEVPETWNTSCLSLLLDADQAYKKRHESDEKDATVSIDLVVLCEDERPAKRPRLRKISLLTPLLKKKKTLLLPADRLLFERLVSYKMLELNLDTILNARVGWTPEKTQVAIGPTVICRSCQFPRSVTIMGASGKCGHCLWTQYTSPEEREAHVTARVAKDDNETTPATWVECNLKTCRAQYVVYRVEALNVKPKCHYCRESKKAPVLECSECLNRVIWPESYRPKNLDLDSFKCYACTAGRKTISNVETTASNISEENTTNWLLRNDKKIAEPFNKRSLFHTISTAGADKFCEKVELFPHPEETTLTLNGKKIRNTPGLIAELQSWVSRRKTEQGTCSLCCSDKRKEDLIPACRRSGCNQRICKPCLGAWYGLNTPGRIINTAALSCPFCSRDPTAKTLAKYGMGIHAVGDLKVAVHEKGQWIFAWCGQCGYARRYIERVCAAGAPNELKDWVCEETCRKVIKSELRLQNCPGCGILTEKVSGCDHVMCAVDGCGVHWCFFCGGRFEEDTIYSHMSESHGGYYGGNRYEDDDDGYDTDW